jgi:hypothetical protein
MERRASIEAAVADLPLMLSVEQTCKVLGIGRSLAYSQVRRNLATGGREGIPALRIGSVIRVPRAGLIDLMLAAPAPTPFEDATLHVVAPAAAPEPSGRTVRPRRRHGTRQAHNIGTAQLPFAGPDRR